jgi:HTH-type transcriptional regulator/antitoxin HipB
LEGTDGLYEIRIEFESNIYWIFCFFDEGQLVVLINSFQKKTQKTPKQELELAQKLKKQYLIDKTIDCKMENETISENKIRTWDNHLDDKYGKAGTVTRTEFEIKAHTFILGELLKEERSKAHLTQAQLAEKTGTKKSYISRIENGHADIQLSTFFRLVEQGFNKKLEFSIH